MATSAILISASVYWRPFWMILSKAAGGTIEPLMLEWLMWLSTPKVYAAWEKPLMQWDYWNAINNYYVTTLIQLTITIM